MSTVRKLSYRSDLRELGQICRDVSAYCLEHEIDPDTALALTLCLDELFTNTLKYGYCTIPAAGDAVFANEASCDEPCEAKADGAYAGCERGSKDTEEVTGGAGQSVGRQLAATVMNLLVEIHLERREDGVVVRYHDKGQPFDPFASLPPLPDVAKITPETLPTGGFGIHLLRKLCSEAHYIRQGDTNTISLTFTWR